MGERVLAIDYGERRVGVAISDPGSGFVSGLPTIERRGSDRALAKAIAAIAGEQAAQRIVVGVPYSLDGSEGPAARQVREFQDQLAVVALVPIEEWDERLTSGAARERLRQIGYAEREIRQRIDQVSAVLMLEAFLQRRKSLDGAPERPA